MGYDMQSSHAGRGSVLMVPASGLGGARSRPARETGFSHFRSRLRDRDEQGWFALGLLPSLGPRRPSPPRAPTRPILCEHAHVLISAPQEDSAILALGFETLTHEFWGVHHSAHKAAWAETTPQTHRSFLIFVVSP